MSMAIQKFCDVYCQFFGGFGYGVVPQKFCQDWEGYEGGEGFLQQGVELFGLTYGGRVLEEFYYCL